MTPATDESDVLPQVPDGWSVFRDPTYDRFYYVNRTSGETVWVLPTSVINSSSGSSTTSTVSTVSMAENNYTASNASDSNTDDAGKRRLPVGWAAYIDAKSSRWYYVGPAGETTWNRPGSLAEQRRVTEEQNERMQQQQHHHQQQQQPQVIVVEQKQEEQQVYQQPQQILAKTATASPPRVNISIVSEHNTTLTGKTHMVPPGPPSAPSVSTTPTWKLPQAFPRVDGYNRADKNDNTSLLSGVPRRRRRSSDESRQRQSSRSLSVQIDIANKGQRLFHLGYDRQNGQPFQLEKL